MTRLSSFWWTGGCRRRTEDPLEVHSSAVVVAAAAVAALVLLRHVGHERLGRQDHRRDRGRVLESGSRHLRGIHDAGLEQVAVLALERVVAEAGLEALDVRNDDLAGLAGVVSDLAGGRLEGLADDVHADLGVAIELDLLEHADGLQEGGPTA